MANISVVLASYNGEKYIQKQIESIMVQLDKDDELIVSDDGSKDSTKEIVKRLSENDSRIKLIDGPQKGYNKNFENAIINTKNEYIFISDQDDEWMPNKVSKVINNFTLGVDCIRHDCLVVNDKGDVIIESYLKERKANTSYRKNIYKNTFTGCCMAVRREWLMKLLPLPEDLYYDAWIGILSCKFKNVKIIDDKLIKWCRHEGTQTSLKRNSILWGIKFRLKLLKMLRRKIKTL
ncbi:MAG: glycosyltransferase [Acholeplasmatales bacterium]|nr:glycosyltransferase [Acholeplasmatales bacterium]